MPKISIQDLESCNEVVTHLITLRSILKDTVKIERILELEIKKLQQIIIIIIIIIIIMN